MSTEQILSPHEAAMLLAFSNQMEEVALPLLATRARIDLTQARSAIERLKLRGAVVQTAEQITTTVSLTDWGKQCAEQQVPELRLWATLAAQGVLSVQAIQRRADMPASEAGAAFGALKLAGVLQLERGQVTLAAGADPSPWQARQQVVEKVGRASEIQLAELTDEERSWLSEKRLRELFKLQEVKERSYQLTELGVQLRGQAHAALDEISQLTPMMLKDGSWQGRRFRRYNIGLPPRVVAGYRNPYRRFLDRTKQTLLALGFEEMRGPLVETEFWDMDALFMPQFHPAREIHDVYFVETPTHAQTLPEPYLSNVAAAHEGNDESGTKGWGYDYDRQRAHRLILRSQGTALSARMLGANPKIPGKYFSLARCFRYDDVDATHAPDFFQIEGIVLSEEITLRHLLGILTLFAREIAQAKEVRASPGYYPFTEPSVEMAMLHPTLGWVELGGAGIFRPEVTQPFGINVPVIAWGLGLDRMAMVALGKNDIRHLFTNHLPNGVGDLRSY